MDRKGRPASGLTLNGWTDVKPETRLERRVPPPAGGPLRARHRRADMEVPLAGDVLGGFGRCG